MDELFDDFFDYDGDGHLSCIELAVGYDLLFGDADDNESSDSEWDVDEDE